jgi:hypothetical protein
MKAIAGAALPLGFALLVWCMITAGYTRNARKIVRALEGSLDAPHGRFVERSATKA